MPNIAYPSLTWQMVSPAFEKNDFRGDIMHSYLIEVDCGFPEVVPLLVEIPHSHLTEVAGMVFV